MQSKISFHFEPLPEIIKHHETSIEDTIEELVQCLFSKFDIKGVRNYVINRFFSSKYEEIQFYFP